MATFVAIVDAGSLTKAAKQLNIPKSNVSRRLVTLESELNSQLLVRTTRKQQLTQSGELLYQSVKEHLNALATAHQTFNDLHNTPQGSLNLLFPIEFFNHAIIQIIADFNLVYPKIKIQCQHYSSSYPKHNVDNDLVFVLHEQSLPTSQWVARNLISFPQSLYASKKCFLQPRYTLTDLSKLDLLSAELESTWLFRAGQQVQVLDIDSIMALSSPEMRMAAVAKSLGVAKLADFHVKMAGYAQQLEKINCEYSPLALQLSVLYQSRTIPAKTRLFLDFFQSKIGCLS